MEDQKRQEIYLAELAQFLRRSQNILGQIDYFSKIPDQAHGQNVVREYQKQFEYEKNRALTNLASNNMTLPEQFNTPQGVLSAFGGYPGLEQFEISMRDIGARATEEQNRMMQQWNATRKSAWSAPPTFDNREFYNYMANTLGRVPDALTIRPIEGDAQPTRVTFGNVQPAAQPTQTPTQTTPTAPAPVTAPVASTPVAEPVAAAPANPFLQGGIPVGMATPSAPAPVSAPVSAPVAAPVTAPTSSFLQTGIPVGTAAPVAAAPVTTTTTGTNMATLTPEELPALRSAGGGGTSAIDPTLRPYLELGLRAAEQQFLQTQPQFFPGQTYVSPSQQTLDALAAQEQIARSAPTTLQAAQESYMRGLGGLGATAGGAFLMGNPFQQQMIEAASRPIMQQFTQQTLPGIASGFSSAGRYGSGAMERALGQATEATSRALGDVGTNIAFQDYSAERGRQQAAILGQITAAGQAPQIYGQQFLPSQQLAQIGAAREAISALPLQEQMQRFQFAQQAPAQQLQSFLSSIYGTPMASSQYAPQQQAQTNRFGNVLGGAATGAAIGSMTGFGAGVGAGVGALGGLLL